MFNKFIEKWKQRIETHGINPIFLIAINKIDTIDNFNEKSQEIINQFFLNSNNIFFISAKTGQGINELFREVARMALLNFVSLPVSSNLILEENHSNCKC